MVDFNMSRKSINPKRGKHHVTSCNDFDDQCGCGYRNASVVWPGILGNDDDTTCDDCAGKLGSSDRSFSEVFTMSAVDTVRAECNGFTFEWGPNKYIVRMGRYGKPVWKRWNDRNGFFRNVNLESRADSSFRAALSKCVELLG